MVETDLVPLPLSRASAVRRGSSAITSPRPQPQAASRPALYVFPRPPMGMGLRADAGGSSTERPGTASSPGDGGLVSDPVSVGTNSPRRQHVALAISSEAGSVISGPSGAVQPAVMSSGAVSPAVSSGAELGRGFPRSVTQFAIPPPPVPVSSPPVGFARSATQALPRLPMSTNFGGALGGNARFGTRAVSAPRPMGTPTGDEDEYDAEVRTILGRTRDGYQDQRAVLRPAGLRSRTQTLGTFSPSTTGNLSGSIPDITSPPTSSGRGNGSRQFSGSAAFVGSPSSPAVMSPQPPLTPGFSSPSFSSTAVSASGGRSRGRGRGSRSSNSSARSGQPQPQPQPPQPQPQLVVEWRERGPALKTVRTGMEAEDLPLRNEPQEEPRSHWSSDTESEPSTMGRMRNAFNRLRSKSRGNLRREASSSFSTSVSLSSLTSRESAPREDIPPVPALPPSLSREVSADSAAPAPPPAPSFPPPPPPVPPVPADDDDTKDANRASGLQTQKQLKKKKSLGNLFSRRRDE